MISHQILFRLKTGKKPLVFFNYNIAGDFKRCSFGSNVRHNFCLVGETYNT